MFPAFRKFSACHVPLPFKGNFDETKKLKSIFYLSVYNISVFRLGKPCVFSLVLCFPSDLSFYFLFRTLVAWCAANKSHIYRNPPTTPTVKCNIFLKLITCVFKSLLMFSLPSRTPRTTLYPKSDPVALSGAMLQLLMVLAR
jgi:hypothetical protein